MINTKQEVKTNKGELLTRIREVITEFRETTGVRVTHVKLEWYNSATSADLVPNLVHVEVAVEIE